MYTESTLIAQRYERRKRSEVVQKNTLNFRYDYYAQKERAELYHEIVSRRFENAGNITLLEIGAGTGVNLKMFRNAGLSWSNIHASELLYDRVSILKENFPGIKVYPGDILELLTNDQFDIVLVSTVFSSILDREYRRKVAAKAWSLTKEGGLVILYDFIYDNPRNKDVRGIPPAEIKKLFPHAGRFRFHSVTLAPPIGRITGKLYGFFNAFRFLRTHKIVEIEKCERVPHPSLKRIFDLVMSVMLLVLMSPVFLLTGVLIKVFMPGPVLFTQKRIGKNAIPFRMYKFRTMKAIPLVDSEQFDAGDTSRVTWFGRILRRTKADELPQLINVLKNDMSFVGPRPEVRQWTNVYADKWKTVHKVKPGITDHASIEFRNEEEILRLSSDPVKTYREVILPRKLDLNIAYVKNHSFKGDIHILVNTLKELILK